MNIYIVLVSWFTQTNNLVRSNPQQQHHQLQRAQKAILNIVQMELNYIETDYVKVSKRFNMSIITCKNLIDIFDNENNNNLTYYIIETYQSLNQFFHFKANIDEVLSSRPWLFIRKFVKYFSEHSSHSSSSSSHNQNIVIKYIIFEKVSLQKLEDNLRIIGHCNYPASEEICSYHPLFIPDIVGDTWGNRKLSSLDLS